MRLLAAAVLVTLTGCAHGFLLWHRREPAATSANVSDRDGDGSADVIDRCPDDPEDRDGFEDDDGCPDPDNDRDGVLDVNDRCPSVPEDLDGRQDQDGCP